MAQNTVKGTVQDKDNAKAIGGTTVNLLFQKDSSTYANTVSANDGSFAFNNVPNDSFIVTINFLDYQQAVRFITLNGEGRDLGKIDLARQGKDLAAVTIVARAAPVVQRGDTSQYSASQFKVNPDATTEDLIKKMPGITVAKDGTVTAQGEQVRKVTIDGKDFFGDDASAALKNLPSEVVDKIQVFDRLSDQAQATGVDDGNSVRAINVVTKSGVKNGQFGRIYVGAGTDNRYQAGGNVSFFKGDRRISLVGNFNNINQQNFGSQDLLGVTGNRGGGGWGRGGNNFMVGQDPGFSRTNAFGVNYNDKWGTKMNVSGSYFFNNSRNTNNASYNTLYNPNAMGLQLNTINESNSLANNFNHRINMRMEYNIDSNNTIFIIPSVNLQANNSRSYSAEQSLYLNGPNINSSVGDYFNDRNGYNISNNLMYRRLLGKPRRSATIGVRTSWNKNNGESISDAVYKTWLTTGEVNDSIINQFADNASNGRQIELDINYIEPLGKNSVLQFEYEPSMQKNRSDQETYRYDGAKYTVFDPLLSNKFDNTITSHEGGVSYRWNQGRDAFFTAALNLKNSRLESDRVFPTVSRVDQTFTNLLPRLMFRKKLSANSNMRLFYRAATNFPRVDQLQDVVNIQNPLTPRSGNPELRQAYNQFLSTNYSFTNSKSGKSFFINIFGNAINDYITNATYILAADSTLPNGITLARGARFTKPINLDGYRSVRTMVTYSIPLNFIKTNFNINGGYNYSKLPGLTNNINTVTLNNVYSAGAGLSSNISEYIDYNISYSANFNNATTKGRTVTKNNFVNHYTNLTLNLLSKNGWFLQNDVTNQT